MIKDKIARFPISALLGLVYLAALLAVTVDARPAHEASQTPPAIVE